MLQPIRVRHQPIRALKSESGSLKFDYNTPYLAFLKLSVAIGLLINKIKGHSQVEQDAAYNPDEYAIWNDRHTRSRERLHGLPLLFGWISCTRCTQRDLPEWRNLPSKRWTWDRSLRREHFGERETGYRMAEIHSGQFLCVFWQSTTTPRKTIKKITPQQFRRQQQEVGRSIKKRSLSGEHLREVGSPRSPRRETSVGTTDLFHNPINHDRRAASQTAWSVWLGPSRHLEVTQGK